MKSFNIGDKVGLDLEPDGIHIIPYDATINHYDGELTAYEAESGFEVQFEDFSLKVPANKVFDGCKEKEGALVDSKDQAIAWEGRKVTMSFLPEDAALSDDAEAGFVAGDIFNFIYMDDYYRYRVRSESEEDYIVNDAYLWNVGDHVSVSVPMEKMKFELK